MIDYQVKLRDSFKKIDKLIATPHRVIDIAVDMLRPHTKPNAISDPFRNIIGALENIASVSLYTEFQIIYNQLPVLSVSAMSAVLEEYFINYSNTNWHKIVERDAVLEKKMTLKQLSQYDFNIKGNLGRLLIEADQSISFQDLGSIIRTFKNYHGIDIILSKDLQKKLVFYMQVRHILVHNDGIINDEYMRRTSPDSNLKNYKKGDKVALDGQDWEDMQEAFEELVSLVARHDIQN